MRTPEASESLERTTITLRWAMLLALAAAGFTFFVLPDLVASRRPAPVPAAAPAAAQPAPAPAGDLQRLADLKQQAEERRAPLPQRLQRLEQRTDHPPQLEQRLR
jgi:hypothetical protein